MVGRRGLKARRPVRVATAVVQEGLMMGWFRVEAGIWWEYVCNLF